MRKSNDVKFIIYQSLYIFVVCVIAIKGANLDLVEVLSKDNVVQKTYADSLKEMLDSLLALGLKPSLTLDTLKFTAVEKEKYAQFIKLQSEPRIDISNYMPKLDMSQYVKKSDIPKGKEPIIDQKPEIMVGTLDLVQYHVNQVNNKGDAPISIKGVTISPHTMGSVQLGGESSVLITSGETSKNLPVRENQKPKVTLQQMTKVMGDDIKLSELQRTTGYRVTVLDDYADQLDVKITGNVISKVVKQSEKEIIIDVTCNAFPSKQAFDNYAQNFSQDKYTSTFSVSVKDRIAPHTVQQVGVFNFSEW